MLMVFILIAAISGRIKSRRGPEGESPLALLNKGEFVMETKKLEPINIEYDDLVSEINELTNESTRLNKKFTDLVQKLKDREIATAKLNVELSEDKQIISKISESLRELKELIK